MSDRPNIYASDAARGAAVRALCKKRNPHSVCVYAAKATGAGLTCSCGLDADANVIIDAFLAKSLEGADEKIAEIRELANACRTWAAENGGGNGFLSAGAAIGLDRAATLVTALSAEKQELAMQALSLSGELEALQSELTATRNALEEERERCAKAVLDPKNQTGEHTPFIFGVMHDCAKAIRALPAPQVKP